MDKDSGIAGLPGLAERTGQTIEVVGPAQEGAIGRWCVRVAAGRRVNEAAEVDEREVRHLPCFEYRTTVVIERYRLQCPDCGLKAEKVAQLPSKAPFSQRFEDAVGLACESAAARRVARQLGMAESTVRGSDLRYLERWAATRRKPANRCGLGGSGRKKRWLNSSRRN